MTAPRLRIAWLVVVLTVAIVGPPASASAPSRAFQSFNVPSSAGDLTEPAVAVDPRDPRRLAILATDYDGFVIGAAGEQVRLAPTCRLSESANLGRTWVSADFAGSHAPAVPYISSSNATLAVDSRGHMYAACLSNNSNAGGAVVFATGSVGTGLTRSQLLSTPGLGPLATSDKPWVTVTPDGSSVAVVWAEFISPSASQIVMRVSHDYGSTFDAPHLVSGVTVGSDRQVAPSSGLPCALFLPSGRLAVAWHTTLAGGEDVMAISVDASAVPPSTSIALREVARSGVQGRYPRHANQPSLALDPTGGAVLLAGGVQTPSGVRATLVRVDTSGRAGMPVVPVPVPVGFDQLNAAVGTTSRGSVGIVFQEVHSGRMDTFVALRGLKPRTWKTLQLSSRTTAVAPYTATSNGTPIGDFIMLVSAGTRFVCVFPQQQGSRMQLTGALVPVS